MPTLTTFSIFSNSLKTSVQLAACFSIVTSVLCTSINANADTLLIKNTHTISGERAEVSSIRDVLIKDGKIVGMGKNLGHADQVIDAHGQYLIPGLIDNHVHLDGVPGYVGQDPQDQPMLKEAREQIPRSYLYFGFTTVLDLTGDPQFIARWNQQAVAPLALFCTPVVIPNGYPAVYFGKDGQFNLPGTKYMLFDAEQASTYPAHFKAEEHTPQAVVQFAKQDDARCIKVFYERGFGPQKNLPVPSVELIQAVVQQAHELSLPVFLHGNSQESYEFALKTGVDTLVHGMWHAQKNVDQFTNQQRLVQMSEEIVKAHIAVQPTMQVLYGEHEELNPDFFKDPQVQHAIPAALRTWYQSPAGQWMKNVLSEQVPPSTNDTQTPYQAMKAMYQGPLNTVRRMTAQLSRSGAKIMFGSDTPSGPFYTQFPGVNGRWEMDRWLEAGLPLAKLFTAMTIENAKTLGLENEIGSVEIGKRANLLLLNGNPLNNVRAYDGISYVILNGKAHKRESLSAQGLQ